MTFTFAHTLSPRETGFRHTLSCSFNGCSSFVCLSYAYLTFCCLLIVSLLSLKWLVFGCKSDFVVGRSVFALQPRNRCAGLVEKPS